MKKIIVLVGLCILLKALSLDVAQAQTNTPTATNSPTNSPTNTAIFTRTFTFTVTPTVTKTVTKTVTNTATTTPTNTPTNTPTATPTLTPAAFRPGPASENTLYNGLMNPSKTPYLSSGIPVILPTSTFTPSPTGTCPLCTGTPTNTFTSTSTITPYVAIALTNTPTCGVCTGTPTMTATPNNPYAYLQNKATGLYDIPMDSQPSLTPSPQIQEMHDSGLQTSFSAVKGSNTPATNAGSNLAIGGVYDQVPAVLTPGQQNSAALDSRSVLYANIEGKQPTYYAAGTWTPSVAAAGLDFQILGVAIQRWHLMHLLISGTATASAFAEFQLIKYSTAGTAGNIVGAVTPIAVDSNDAAGAILVKPYSTPATPGTVLATLWDDKIVLDSATIAQTISGPPMIDMVPQCGGCKGIILNAAAENVGIVAPSALPAGTVLYIQAVLTKE